MKLLHYVEIENFKRYGEIQRIELDHPAVLIGPNNCGKTSALQAIALWSIGLRTWRLESENSKAEKRLGKALNRLGIVSVPVPQTRHFWHDLKAGNRLRITVAVDVGGQPVPVSMTYTHHSSDEIVYCQPTADTLANEGAVEAGAKLDVSLLYPMSGTSADEAVIQPNRINYNLGLGRTSEVIRNLCLMVQQTEPQDWQEITELMRRLFRVRLSVPVENEIGAVDLGYEQEGTGSVLDLSLSGRGFQQMLLIFAHLYSHKGSVLLVDEPDAHLEILRQQQVYVLLRDIAHRNGCQVVMVTHSEVVLREALETNLTLILGGQAENLAKKTDITNALKHFGAEHYVKARETGHVLYVEGGTDVDMLRAFADKLEHPVMAALDDGARLNVYYLQDNFPGPERNQNEELERVEGGYGMSAAEHYHALRGMIPDLRGLVIHDSDGNPRREGNQAGLEIRVWKRYEPENYFITPELLLAWADKQMPPGEDLFARTRQQILDELILEQTFEGEAEDFANYQKVDPSTRKTLWRAQTQNKKLSWFAEEFFRRLAKETGTRMLARKGGLHELVALCDPSELNGEVREKLDALHRLLNP
ncbi:MAG: AAA family ATPase [Verrucomicrobiales bacterium]|nr:AAA family ATPase [Verrucomicrobiales bacterium]